MKIYRVVLAVIMAIGFPSLVFASNTPVQNPLNIQTLRYGNTANADYVVVLFAFNSSVMPGCYSSSLGTGGVLYQNHPQFKEIMASILMMKAMSGRFAGQVFYDLIRAGGQLSDCQITGLQVQ